MSVLPGRDASGGAWLRILALSTALCVVATAVAAQETGVPRSSAQQPADPQAIAPQPGAQRSMPEPWIGPLTSTLDLRALQDLPSSVNLFSLLETAQPEVVSDRFSGSVNLAEPARLGVFLTSWTQTTFLMDGVDITSADRGGPLFVPPVAAMAARRRHFGRVPH